MTGCVCECSRSSNISLAVWSGTECVPCSGESGAFLLDPSTLCGSGSPQQLNKAAHMSVLSSHVFGSGMAQHLEASGAQQ